MLNKMISKLLDYAALAERYTGIGFGGLDLTLQSPSKPIDMRQFARPIPEYYLSAGKPREIINPFSLQIIGSNSGHVPAQNYEQRK